MLSQRVRTETIALSRTWLATAGMSALNLGKRRCSGGRENHGMLHPPDWIIPNGTVWLHSTSVPLSEEEGFGIAAGMKMPQLRAGASGGLMLVQAAAAVNFFVVTVSSR
jgi:hypothetical protein